MDKNIALSTSFSVNHNWDPIYSIELTRKYGLKYCQIYIGDNFKDKELIDKINSFTNIGYIFHSNFDLNLLAINSREIEIIKSINSDEKLVVYHHCNAPIHEVIDCVKELNQFGITVLLENFYFDYGAIEDTVNSFIEILDISKKRGLNLLPLIDIPRLFIDKVKDDSLELTSRILQKVKNLDMPLYTHLIDSKNKTQERGSWCPIGSGYIPYDDIYNYIEDLGIYIPLQILELEEEGHIKESLSYLC